MSRLLRRLLGVFKAFSLRFDPPSGLVSLGVEVDPVAGVTDAGRFAEDLAMLFEVLGATSPGSGNRALILAEELQEASAADLSAVNTAVHQMGQSDIPLLVVFVGAGLASLPAQLADATSYAERLYDYRPVGLLDPAGAAAALTGRTFAHGVVWEPDALQAALAIAGGYPYFLQEVGKHVWDAARSSTINLDDVSVGGEFARREVDEGLYRSRWERATPAQQKLLRVMGELGGDAPVAIAELAKAMGRRRVSGPDVAARAVAVDSWAIASRARVAGRSPAVIADRARLRFSSAALQRPLCDECVPDA